MQAGEYTVRLLQDGVDFADTRCRSVIFYKRGCAKVGHHRRFRSSCHMSIPSTGGPVDDFVRLD